MGGSGLVANAVTVNGTVAPGATKTTTAGTTLTIGTGVTFNTNSNFAVNLDFSANGGAGAVDLLAINGPLTLNGTDTLTVNVLNGSTPNGSTFIVATFTPNSLAGSSTNFVLDPTSTAAGYQVITNNSAGNVEILAIPEASTTASIFGGLGILVVCQRFRRRSA